MEQATIRMPKRMLADVDELVEEESYFADRSEAIRYAIREMLQQEMAR